MKEVLTKQEKLLMPDIANKWKGIFNNNKNYIPSKVFEGIEWVYQELCGKEKPKIFICESPMKCQLLANEIKGNTKHEYFEPSSYLSYSDSGWVAFYDFFSQIGVLKDDKFNKYKELMSQGVYYTLCFEGLVITSLPPTEAHLNNNEQLHNVSSHAYLFADGYCGHFVNGRGVPKELIEQPITKQMILSEKNEDLKAAMITIVKERDGQQALLDLLGAEIVDEKQIQHMPGYKETVRLYKTKEKHSILQDRNGNMNQPYCWSEMVCPSTGQTYLIENSADFTCAEEAIKWLRPSFVPQELIYQWENFAN